MVYCVIKLDPTLIKLKLDSDLFGWGDLILSNLSWWVDL